MSDPKLKALGQVPLFEHCSRKELEFIATRGDEVAVPAGQTLTREGRPGDTFYVLLDGEAEVEISGRRRRVLTAGDFLGEISMVERGHATAAETPVRDARMDVRSHAGLRD